jgi:hypothetical protein
LPLREEYVGLSLSLQPQQVFPGSLDHHGALLRCFRVAWCR